MVHTTYQRSHSPHRRKAVGSVLLLIASVGVVVVLLGGLLQHTLIVSQYVSKKTKGNQSNNHDDDDVSTTSTTTTTASSTLSNGRMVLNYTNSTSSLSSPSSSSTTTSTTLSTSDDQQKWRDFEQEIGRSVFYITGRFHREPGTFQGIVDRFQNRIIESGMDPSRIFAYADTFPEFILKDHRWKRHLEFLNNTSASSRGGGYWFWKAALLQHHMTHSMKDGDFVIYSDADTKGRDANLKYMDDLLRTMIRKGSNLAAWRYRDDHGTRGKTCCPEKQWNKRDVYEYYCPGRNQTLDLTGQFHAAWFLLEKTPDTMEFIQQYLEGVSNFHFVSDEASYLLNGPGYIDNRHDQSIFSLLLKCRYREEGIEKFHGTSPLPGKKNRIHMLSITSTNTNT